MKVLGIMSGTSLDGVDLLLADFSKKETYQFDILAFECLPYPPEWIMKLKQAFRMSGQELISLDHAYGAYLGNICKDFMNKYGKADYIASHGHTFFHQPNHGFTYQIGNGHDIFYNSSVPVINDFRSEDVVKGGNGAPLVPIGDLLLFPEYKYCLNLGGFANISIKKNNTITAFDIGFCNIVLNELASTFGLKYDEGGKLAEKGKLIHELFELLNEVPYYIKKGPKSLGREWVDDTILPLIMKYPISFDVLYTVTYHIAFQISRHLDNGQLLITGGGTYNNFLTGLIREMAPDVTITIPDEVIINGKEAFIFAFMGYLRVIKQNNVLSSVTGAKSDSSAGIIYDS